MYHSVIPVVYFLVSRECLDQVSAKYHLIDGDGSTLPGPDAVIDRPPLGKVGFYLYKFDVGLRMHPSPFFGSIIEAYKIHTCQLKPNSNSKVICFELLCHASWLYLLLFYSSDFFVFVVMGHGIIIGLGDRFLLKVFLIP